MGRPVTSRQGKPAVDEDEDEDDEDTSPAGADDSDNEDDDQDESEDDATPEPDDDEDEDADEDEDQADADEDDESEDDEDDDQPAKGKLKKAIDSDEDPDIELQDREALIDEIAQSVEAVVQPEMDAMHETLAETNKLLRKAIAQGDLIQKAIASGDAKGYMLKALGSGGSARPSRQAAQDADDDAARTTPATRRARTTEADVLKKSVGTRRPSGGGGPRSEADPAEGEGNILKAIQTAKDLVQDGVDVEGYSPDMLSDYMNGTLTAADESALLKGIGKATGSAKPTRRASRMAEDEEIDDPIDDEDNEDLDMIDEDED